MPKLTMPSGSGHISVPLEHTEGKLLQAIHIFQTEGSLNLDLRFQDDVSLELLFEMAFKASANVLQYQDGNARVLKKLRLRGR